MGAGGQQWTQEDGEVAGGRESPQGGRGSQSGREMLPCRADVIPDDK